MATVDDNMTYVVALSTDIKNTFWHLGLILNFMAKWTNMMFKFQNWVLSNLH